MENIKLFQLLLTLTRNEFNSLGEFLKSSYFNKSGDIIRLYGFLKNHFPEFEKLNKEKIFSSLFPHEKYKDKKLRDLFSKMLGLVEEFLALEDLKNYPLEEKKHVLNQYSVRNLDKHFEGLSREMQVLLDKIKIRDNSYFYSSFLLKKDSRNYFEQKKLLGKRGEFFEEMNNEVDRFILFFIYNMLKYYIEQINQQKLQRHNPNLEFAEHISNYISNRNIDNEPQINILFTCLQMLLKPAENHHFSNLKKLLETGQNSMNKDDLRVVYVQMYNYSREKLLEEKTEFKTELFEIIKKMIILEIYPMELGYITSQTFINFVSAGLQVNEFNWSLDFMEKFRENITPVESESTYKYCLALLNYRKGNTGKALEMLAEVKTEDFYFYLRVKNQTSKIYFERGEYESLLSLLDTFRHYIASNYSIPDYISSRYINYTLYLKKVVNAKLSGDEFNLKKLHKEIEDASEFENKTWLLENIH